MGRLKGSKDLKKRKIRRDKGKNKLGLNEEEVIRLYLKEKKTLQEVSKIFNCSKNAIYKILKEKRIKCRKYKEFNKEEMGEIIDLYTNQYITLEKLSKKFKISTQTMRRILMENEVKIRKLGYKQLNNPLIKCGCGCGKTFLKYDEWGGKRKYIKAHSQRKNLNEKEIINLYLKEKISPYKIAKIFGYGVKAIYKRLKENNIHIFPRGFFNKGKISWNKGLTKNTDKRVKGTSQKLKKLWENPEYAKKMLGSLLLRPTSFEQKIINLCLKYGLRFTYTGDGRILIGHKNPDFINEKDKVIIEVFLNYFKIRDYGSVENYIQERGKYFAKYGYKTIFIREEEIIDKNWEEICLSKIQNFK